MQITQNPHPGCSDVAVVLQTTLANSALNSALSVFRQDFGGRVHLLIGVDCHHGDPAVLDAIRAACPDRIMLTILDPGYSTSVRHGGLYSNAYGGALRTILSMLANSDRIAYLDDNDWYHPTHLRTLAAAMAGRQWAYSYRWLVDPHTLWPICRDEWDSVGPGRGINAARFGGFVQASTLMLDRQACRYARPLWSQALFPDGTGEDRLIFEALHKNFSSAASGAYSCFCALNTTSIGDAHHVDEFVRRGLHWVNDRSLVAVLQQHLAAAAQYREQGEIEAASRECEAALRIHPHHPGAGELRAACQLHEAAL
jgi:hypothetical protein